MTELRQAPRQRTLKGGMIVLNDGRSTIECTVRNLSASGARLRVTSIVGIPDSFELRLSDDSKHRCTVAWRRAEELGVKFL